MATTVDELQRLNSELNAQVRQYRLQIANLRARLHVAEMLLRGRNVQASAELENLFRNYEPQVPHD